MMAVGAVIIAIQDLGQTPPPENMLPDLEPAVLTRVDPPDPAPAWATAAAADHSLAAARNAGFPDLSGNASYGWQGAAFPLNYTWSMGLTLSTQLYTGGGLAGKTDEAGANLAAAQAELGWIFNADRDLQYLKPLAQDQATGRADPTKGSVPWLIDTDFITEPVPLD